MSIDTITLHLANTESGEYDVMKPKPYPLRVDARTGDVLDQDMWRGDPAAVIGFQYVANVQTCDLVWAKVAAHPHYAEGAFPILVNSNGKFSTWTTPVTEVTVVERGEREDG